MRTVTFSDPRVADRLAKNFVCVWRNIRPSEEFKDGARKATRAQLSLTQPGAGSANICAFVATSDGQILHAAQGYFGPDEFLKELEFGLEAMKLSSADRAAERLKGLYASRQFAAPGKRDLAAGLLRVNLRWLAGHPLHPLERLAQNPKAGLLQEAEE